MFLSLSLYLPWLLPQPILNYVGPLKSTHVAWAPRAWERPSTEWSGRKIMVKIINQFSMPNGWLSLLNTPSPAASTIQIHGSTDHQTLHLTIYPDLELELELELEWEFPEFPVLKVQPKLEMLVRGRQGYSGGKGENQSHQAALRECLCQREGVPNSYTSIFWACLRQETTRKLNSNLSVKNCTTLKSESLSSLCYVHRTNTSSKELLCLWFWNTADSV